MGMLKYALLVGRHAVVLVDPAEPLNIYDPWAFLFVIIPMGKRTPHILAIQIHVLIRISLQPNWVRAEVEVKSVNENSLHLFHRREFFYLLEQQIVFLWHEIVFVLCIGRSLVKFRIYGCREGDFWLNLPVYSLGYLILLSHFLALIRSHLLGVRWLKARKVQFGNLLWVENVFITGDWPFPLSKLCLRSFLHNLTISCNYLILLLYFSQKTELYGVPCTFLGMFANHLEYDSCIWFSYEVNGIHVLRQFLQVGLTEEQRKSLAVLGWCNWVIVSVLWGKQGI